MIVLLGSLELDRADQFTGVDVEPVKDDDPRPLPTPR
jgi:hypothetical protein